MKIRNGFVSNSSSSSFIVYGVKVERNVDVDWKILREHKLSIEDDILGSVLMSEVEEQSFDKIDFDPIEIKNNIENFVKEFDVKVDMKTIGLYAGNSEC